MADDLKTQYTIENLDFNASSIYPDIKEDFILYHFDENQHHKAFSSQKLISRLKKHGVTVNDDVPKIVHIQRTSDIDLDPISQKIKSYYRSYYPSITIEKVSIKTNSFVGELPSSYTLHFRPKAYLYNRSTLQMTSNQSKERYFLSYELHAKMKVFKARHNINRGKILTQIDVIYKSENFSRLKGIPLDTLDKGQIRLKKRLVTGKILYAHDIEALPYVLKDQPVSARIVSGKVHIEFLAVSLQDGQKDEYIFIKKTDGIKLKAKVIGQNLVEVE